MAFKDKVSNFANKAVEQAGDLAKKGVEQAGDMVEITKIKNRIKDAEKDIISLKMDIADYYLAKGELDESISQLGEQIQEKMELIEQYEEEIEQIKE